VFNNDDCIDWISIAAIKKKIKNGWGADYTCGELKIRFV
jgi:hypothetical protein